MNNWLLVYQIIIVIGSVINLTIKIQYKIFFFENYFKQGDKIKWTIQWVDKLYFS